LRRTDFKKAICFFLSRSLGFWDQGHASVDHGKFVVREYDRWDRLRPLERPSRLRGHRFRRIQWQKTEDYPLLLKFKNIFTPRVLTALRGDRDSHPHHRGLKVGGWPTSHLCGADSLAHWDVQVSVKRNFSFGGSYYYAWLARESNGWCIHSNVFTP
jgi:hypothetical protein